MKEGGRKNGSFRVRVKRGNAAEGTYVDTAVRPSFERCKFEEPQLAVDIRRHATRESGLDLAKASEVGGWVTFEITILSWNTPLTCGFR